MINHIAIPSADNRYNKLKNKNQKLKAMIEVYSYSDFESRLSGNEKSYLLLYKKGNEKSDCAFFNVLSGSAKVKNAHIFHADVNIVHDIHEKYNITSVPVLLEFRKGEFINNIKGCNDANHYKAIFSGIIIPDSEIEKQAIGKVLAISTVENAEIAIGDRVLYKEHIGTETEFEGKKYLFIPYAEILAKIVETDKI